MRSAARRGTTCRYDISFEITGGNQASMVSGNEMDGDDGEGALDGARYTRRDARQACVHRIHELYGIRRNAISDVRVTREGRDNFRLSGKVVRHQSLADSFTCRVTHGEVVAQRARRDRAALLRAPERPYLVVVRTSRRVARDGFISFEGRRYLVPKALPGERIEVTVGERELEMRRAGQAGLLAFRCFFIHFYG